MSGRADRWWRPSTAKRPAQRARARRLYTGKELDTTFDLGYTIGQADEAKRSRERDEQITRLARAADAAQNGDPAQLLDLADAAGVTPPGDVDGEQLVADIEQWLRGQDGDG